MRAALEEELKRVRVEQVVTEATVSILNVAVLRAGLVPGSEGEQDLGQTRMGIEAVRALLPLVEQALGGGAGETDPGCAVAAADGVRAGGRRGAAEPGSDAPDARRPAPESSRQRAAGRGRRSRAEIRPALGSRAVAAPICAVQGVSQPRIRRSSSYCATHSATCSRKPPSVGNAARSGIASAGASMPVLSSTRW